MKTPSQRPFQISATARRAAAHETRHGAMRAINAPLNVFTEPSQNRNFGSGRKTTYHPSRFGMRHSMGRIKQVLNGLYREFLESVAFAMTGKEQSNG